MGDTIAIDRVDHIGIRVRHLDRAMAFYRVLGFELAHRAKGDDVAIVRNAHGVELNLSINQASRSIRYGSPAFLGSGEISCLPPVLF
jgi:catechol 2,3-dioxygenase-like lactoylglutathione lyase family enzyme